MFKSNHLMKTCQCLTIISVNDITKFSLLNWIESATTVVMLLIVVHDFILYVEFYAWCKQEFGNSDFYCGGNNEKIGIKWSSTNFVTVFKRSFILLIKTIKINKWCFFTFKISLKNVELWFHELYFFNISQQERRRLLVGL